MSVTVAATRLVRLLLVLLVAWGAAASLVTRFSSVAVYSAWKLGLILAGATAACCVPSWAFLNRLLLPHVKSLSRLWRAAFVLASVSAGLACVLLYRPDRSPLPPQTPDSRGHLAPVRTVPVTAWGQTVEAFRLDARRLEAGQVQASSQPSRAVLLSPSSLSESGGTLELLIAPPEPAPLAAGAQSAPAGAGPRLDISVMDENREWQRVKEWTVNPLHNPGERAWNTIRVEVPAGARAITVDVLPASGQPAKPPGAPNSFVYIQARPADVPWPRVRHLADWVSLSLLVAALLWGAAYTRPTRTAMPSAPAARLPRHGGSAAFLARPAALSRRTGRTRPTRPSHAPTQAASAARPAGEPGPAALPGSPTVRPRRARIAQDLVIGFCLAAAAALASFTTARRVAPLCLNEQHLIRYFEGDCIPRFESMTDRQSSHRRSNVHPLFSLLTYPTVSAIRWAAGVEPLTAVLLLLGATAAGWLAAVYATLRLSGCRRLDAVVFSLLAATSASAVFWFIVPETYPFGSLTILVPLLLVAIAQHRRVRTGWHLAASALSLSITTTNWMSGIVAGFVRLPVIRAVAITGLAFGIYLALWPLQKSLFRDVRFITEIRDERAYVKQVQTAGRQNALLSFIYHAMVMPDVRVTKEPPNIVALTTQGSAPGSHSVWGLSAAGLWSILLALGVIGVVRAHGQLPFRIALAAILLGQLALHLNYGGETFLYSCNFGVLLVLLSAWGTRTRARPLVLGLAGVLIVCAAVNNFSALAHVMEIMQAHMTAAVP